MTELISSTDKIFVAGHLGMAGSAIVRRLHQYGFGSVGDGELLTIPRSKLDLRDFSLVNDWFARNKPTVVVLAAAKVGGIKANANYPVEFLLDNLKIQNNLIEASWRNGVRRFCFLASSCIYPKFAQQPIKEEELLTGSLEPTNEGYAIAKIAGIKLCEALRIQYGFDAFSLMPTNLYGPGDNYHPQNSHVMAGMIRRFAQAKQVGLNKVFCWGSGTPRREFLHVDDLADAVVFSLKNWKPTRGELGFLNVGQGIDLTIQELAENVADAVGFQGDIEWDETKPDGTPRKLLDVSRMSAKGWSYKISLEDGIVSTVKNLSNEVFVDL